MSEMLFFQLLAKIYIIDNILCLCVFVFFKTKVTSPELVLHVGEIRFHMLHHMISPFGLHLGGIHQATGSFTVSSFARCSLSAAVVSTIWKIRKNLKCLRNKSRSSQTDQFKYFVLTLLSVSQCFMVNYGPS